VKSGGSIVIAVLFMILMSVSGLALLTHSLLHNAIIAARSKKWQRGIELEQAVVQYLHAYRQRLDEGDMNLFAAPQDDYFNCSNFPETGYEDTRVRSLFSRRTLIESGVFSRIQVSNLMTACRPASRLQHHALASVDLLQGDIPLSELFLLLNKEIDGRQSSYLAGKGVEWAGRPMIDLPGKPPISGDGRIALAAALGLPGSCPDWRQIREKLGLEPSAAAVPPGVYLALGPELVEAVFVEGDLQLLQFGAADGLQSITFVASGCNLELSYRPGQRSLCWSGPEAVDGFGFSEKIVVHGGIVAVMQSGEAAFAASASIQVLASGRITVGSGLVGEKLGLQKTKFARLLLMTEGRDFFSGAALDAAIDLAADDGSIIEAHLVSAGTVVHGDGRLSLSGCLVADDIENSGRLRLSAAAGRFDLPAQRVLKNFKCLQNFRVLLIAEGSDE
jgi:hypothetical protein